ncbi:2Fe-2S ferredoxin [Salinisphaera orenii MK-B5]|uniref:2Fe-2S ferredoxin n=1 Tax=Salinisphaera orenii MK-B5 TaxID=856730 RepID=A0A423PNH5_9GAMM|nr:aromatic ring-hydroxylating dioxygenase subunit alpha [Salinisphaera orenii]ROO27127.1 2Fe-2S ferredoxin [Salinisphaera orenii MK-B5]
MTETVLTPRVIEQLNRPTGDAVCLPNAAYTSPEILDRERDEIFDRQWVIAGVGAELPRRGDVVPVEIAGRPVVLTRNRADAVRAFHNVCRHRGLQLVGEARRGCATLVCPYHSWAYSLDGELKKTPHFGGHDCDDSPALDRRQYGLAEIRCETWYDLIFVNLSGDAPPLADCMGPLESRWADYDLSRLRHGGSATFEVEANWKLAVENFVESYHLPWTHPSLNDYSRMQAHFNMLEPTYMGQGSQGYDSVAAGHPDLPTFPDLPEARRSTAEYPYVMPNLMLGMHPSYLFVFAIQPLSPERTREIFHFYFVGDAAMGDDLAAQRQRPIEAWTGINAEDIEMIEGMQRGRHSPGYAGGRFSPYHEATTHEFQRRIANQLGRDTAAARVASE